MYRPDILKSLVVVSVAAVLATPLYIIFYLSPSFDRFLLENVERDAARASRHLATMFLGGLDVITGKSLPTNFAADIRKAQDDFGLPKVKVYSADGKAVFSTVPAETGRKHTRKYFKDIVAKGFPYTAVVNKDSSPIEGEMMSFDAVESYTPIMKNGKFIGAFEIYYDISAVRQCYEAFIKKVYAILITITSGLLFAVIASLAKVHRSIVEQARAEGKIIKQSAELKKMNTELSVLYEVSRKRQEEVLAAQQEKLAALEKVQEEMTRHREMRLELLRHTVKAQEDERTRIARELHDETAQILTAASLNMEALKPFVVEQPAAEDLISRNKSLCRQMSQGLYRLVHDLRPAQLDDLGLVPALEHLVEEGVGQGKVLVTLQITGRPQRLDPFVETVLYRTVQEALTNIVKYAEVDQAAVQLNFGPEQIVLRVRDQGAGFDPDKQTTACSGWGLAGIRERVEAIKGHLFLQSAPGVGTLIEVVVPVTGGDNRTNADLSNGRGRDNG